MNGTVSSPGPWTWASWVYDQSWRVGLGTQLGMPLIERLAGLDNVVSLKYGSPNIMEDTVVALERFSDRFAFIDNSLAYTAGLSHMHGATDFISGPSTWWPEFELQFFRFLEEGEYPGRRPLARPDSALYGLVPRRVLVRSPLLPRRRHHKGVDGVYGPVRRAPEAAVPRHDRR